MQPLQLRTERGTKTREANYGKSIPTGKWLKKKGIALERAILSKTS